MAKRYEPTEAERQLFLANGWKTDNAGWWFDGGLGRGHTAKEALREQMRRDWEGGKYDKRKPNRPK